MGWNDRTDRGQACRGERLEPIDGLARSPGGPGRYERRCSDGQSRSELIVGPHGGSWRIRTPRELQLGALAGCVEVACQRSRAEPSDRFFPSWDVHLPRSLPRLQCFPSDGYHEWRAAEPRLHAGPQAACAAVHRPGSWRSRTCPRLDP